MVVLQTFFIPLQVTTSVGDPGSVDPGSGSAYFYRVSDPGSAIRAKTLLITSDGDPDPDLDP